MELLRMMLQIYYISIPAILIFLAFQLYLCFKVKRIVLKFVPVFIIVLLIIYAQYTVTEGNFTGFDGIFVFIFLYSGIVVPGVIGVAVAWIALGIYKLSHRSHKKNQLNE